MNVGRRIAGAARFLVQQRTHRLAVLPTLILYLNDVCNSKCLGCAIWQNNERLQLPAEREMSAGLLDEIYETVARWRPAQVMLSGGEPTIHPAFATVVERVSTLGSRVLVATNGLTLSSMKRASIGRIDEFFISFDAPDAASYELIRGVDGFDRLAGGLHFLSGLRPPSVRIARCTLQRENAGRVTELVDSARRMGFGRISFLAVDVSSDAFARHHADHAVERGRIQPTAAELADLSRGIRELESKGADPFVEGGTARLRNIEQYFRALLGQDDYPVVRCNAPWFSTVVETTGRIRGCFFHRRIGALRELNGSDAMAFRRSLRVSDNQICRSCVCSRLLTVSDLLRM